MTDTTINRPVEAAATKPALHRARSMRWLGVVITIALVAVTAGLAYRAIIGTPPEFIATSDRSWDQAEALRFHQLAPAADLSAERAELSRMTALAFPGDTSWERAEEERMRRLAVDG